jgi:hypothetical protein
VFLIVGVGDLLGVTVDRREYPREDLKGQLGAMPFDPETARAERLKGQFA